jgi:dienelactone hydrolase
VRRRNLSPWAYWRLHLASVRDRDPLPLDDLDASFGPWRERLRERLAALLGPMPDAVPLDLEVVASEDCDGYRRDTVVFDTEAAMSVPAHLLVPHDRTAPGTAVLAVHGHGAGKSMVCGIDGGDPARRAEIDEQRGDYAHRLARRGHVVLAPDLRGFGERVDPHPPDRYPCDWELVCATMAGVHPLARNLWDLQRCLDVLARHPLVDESRLGAAGLSYGATTTLFLAATDTRVRACLVSGFLSSWRAAHEVPWNMCGSQVLAGQLGELEHVDLGCLVAPRGLAVETGTDDEIFPLTAARASMAALGRVYAHLGAPDHVEHDVFDGGHRWNGGRALDALERWL